MTKLQTLSIREVQKLWRSAENFIKWSNAKHHFTERIEAKMKHPITFKCYSYYETTCSECGRRGNCTKG